MSRPGTFDVVGDKTLYQYAPDVPAGGRSTSQSRRENRDSVFSEVPTYSSQRS